VPIEHGTQRLSALSFVAGLSSSTRPVFPEHTLNKVLERVCTRGLVHVSRGDLHIYVYEYSLGDISANQSLCCCVQWHWYAVITIISETSHLLNVHTVMACDSMPQCLDTVALATRRTWSMLLKHHPGIDWLWKTGRIESCGSSLYAVLCCFGLVNGSL